MPVLLFVLAVAAVAAIYFLFLRSPAGNPPTELTAEIIHDESSSTPSTRLNYEFSPEEKKAMSPEQAVPQKPAPKEPLQVETPAGSANVESSPAEPKPESVPAQSPSPPGPNPVPTLTEAEKAPSPPVPQPEPAQPTPPAAPSPPQGGETWVINALSTQDAVKARQVVGELMSQPYHVYSYAIEIKGVNWYRIRVGFFSSKAEAEKAGMKLSRDFKLPPPWILRPSSKEIEEYRSN